MKKRMIVMMALVTMSLSPVANAAYLTFPGISGEPLPGSTGCSFGLGGGSVASVGGICYVSFPVPVESGKTLSSVTLYFYDNSGSQSLTASLLRKTLSATSDFTSLASGSDTTTSSSAQFLTLSYGSATSSSYVYWVLVTLSSGTELRGIKIYYY